MRKRRWVGLGILLVSPLLLLIPVVSRHVVAGSSDLEGEHEQIVYVGSTACGVERWHVKTGIDSDARKINLAHVENTNILHLRSLPAPSFLPNDTRIAPTERTVFRVSAYLLRFKEESDSDYHLVLADSGGRTMIAEIPAPDCVGSSSPFLSRIRTVRSQFDRRYRVSSTSWRRLKVAVTVTGVGFFDFKHGQSGVAPNAIELHPVLALSFGKSTASPPAAAPATRPPTSRGGSFSVTAWVSPSTMKYGAYPTLHAKTLPGASCSASVRYSTGHSPRSFDGSTRTVGSSGTLTWTWHEETKNGGTATVTCSYRGQSKTATTSFTVT